MASSILTNHEVETLLEVQNSITHPRIEKIKKNKLYNHNLQSNREFNEQRRIFSVDQVSNQDNSWNKNSKFISPKLWNTYEKENNLQHDIATLNLLNKQEQSKNNYKNFVNIKRDETQKMLYKRKLERLSLGSRSNQPMIEEFNDTEVDVRNAVLKSNRNKLIEDSIKRSSMHKKILPNCQNTFNDYSKLSESILNSIYTKKVYKMEEGAISRIKEEIAKDIDSKFHSKSEQIRDTYFVSRTKRDKFNEYCDGFDNLKTKHNDLIHSDSLSKQLTEFGMKKSDLNYSESLECSKHSALEDRGSKSSLNLEKKGPFYYYSKPLALHTKNQNSDIQSLINSKNQLTSKNQSLKTLPAEISQRLEEFNKDCKEMPYIMSPSNLEKSFTTRNDPKTNRANSIIKNQNKKIKDYRELLDKAQFDHKIDSEENNSVQKTERSAQKSEIQDSGHKRSVLKEWEKSLFLEDRNIPPLGTRHHYNWNNSDYKRLKSSVLREKSIQHHRDLLGLNLNSVKDKYVYADNNQMFDHFTKNSGQVRNKIENTKLKDELLSKYFNDFHNSAKDKSISSSRILSSKHRKNIRSQRIFSFKENPIIKAAKLTLERTKFQTNNISPDKYNLDGDDCHEYKNQLKELDRFDKDLKKSRGVRDTRKFPAINLQQSLFLPKNPEV